MSRKRSMLQGGLVLALLGAFASQPHAAEPATMAPAGGLRPPSQASVAALNKALAELDRSANTIVADVGSRTVTWGEVADAMRALPPGVAGIPVQMLYQTVLQQLIADKAMAERAEAAGLPKSPIARRRVNVASDHALADDYARLSLVPNLSTKALKALYDAVIAGKPGPTEVHGRIIVVEQESDGEDIIRRLRAGAVFTEIARQESKDGTASSGGDLGFVRREMLEPALAAVMFSLDVGQVTAHPVRVGAYWFVAQVDARREAPTPSFEEARGALAMDVTEFGKSELREQALKLVPITFYGMAGKSATAGKKANAAH